MTDPEYKERKMIVVDSCDTCPYTHKCKAWLRMNRREVVSLTLKSGLGKFILKGCPLPYGEDNAQATDLTV